MPNITNIEVEATVTMDNGETVKVSIHDNGSGSSYGASTAALGASVDLREALGQVVYDAYVARGGDEDEDEEPDTRYPFVSPGGTAVLTGPAWEQYGLRNHAVQVSGMHTFDPKVGPVPYFLYGSDTRIGLDPDADDSFAYGIPMEEPNHPRPFVGRSYVLTGEDWALYDLRGEVVRVTGVLVTDDETVGRFEYGDGIQGRLDANEGPGYAYHEVKWNLDKQDWEPVK